MKNFFTTILIVIIGWNMNAQNVTIPDANFKAALAL